MKVDGRGSKWSRLVLREAMTRPQWAGVAVIVAGVAVLTGEGR